jgi:hypothetical protein
LQTDLHRIGPIVRERLDQELGVDPDGEGRAIVMDVGEDLGGRSKVVRVSAAPEPDAIEGQDGRGVLVAQESDAPDRLVERLGGIAEAELAVGRDQLLRVG